MFLHKNVLDVSSTIIEINDCELKNGRRGHFVNRNSYCVHSAMRCKKLVDCKIVFGNVLESVLRFTRSLFLNRSCNNELHD